MDKEKLKNFALVLLPLAAVVLAGMPGCVTVLNKEMTEPMTCSMFTLIEDVQWAICLPLAGILGAVTFGLGVIHLVTKKAFWCKIILVGAFATMTLSVVPLLVRQETILIPNMLIPILLGVESLLAYAMIPKNKQPEKAEPKLLKRK